MSQFRTRLYQSGFTAALVLSLISNAAIAQTARISEESVTIKTYPFGGPDAIPILVKDARLYPYHSFQSYAHEGEDREWKVVKLENEFIEVYVLPEAGGKVWGAIEKSTGHEFIYRNEVMKFRNISLRGPWTSGGIEFNFGIIGHTPATATPVDYLLKENEDGSVSCFVGAMDLPSRTNWRVEVRLAPNKAYFETRALWSNPMPTTQPYYNWMTAAAFATDDLVVSFPGPRYLRHSGQALAWPIDSEGRDLSQYRNNAFDGAKSYHVVGEYNDYFGGYYTDDEYGFGHWSPHSDMPGQKLWIWALSREGGIWEDLLTDTDGQYVEFQAGRLFVQYSAGSHVNPITQAEFEPGRTDQWTEYWFPLKEIGGMNSASPYGAMFVRIDDSQIVIGVNAFEDTGGLLTVIQNGRVVHERPLDMHTLEAVNLSLEIDTSLDFEVSIPQMDLHYYSNPAVRQMQRPFDTSPEARPALSVEDRLVFDGKEMHKARRYSAAGELFSSALDLNPWNRDALLAAADLSYRAAKYDEGLRFVNRALQLDAYDPDANFVAGILYRANGDIIDAREAFGWAARSTTYRSSANVQLAEVFMTERDAAGAFGYARKALDYDANGVSALEVLALSARKSGNPGTAVRILERLLELDPLNHFSYFERYLMDESDRMLSEFTRMNNGEYADQTMLELAISYYSRGFTADAVKVLTLGTARYENAIVDLWLAYLTRTADPELSDSQILLAAQASPAFVFPYRRETIAVLEWANEHDDNWIWKYYLGLNLWSNDRTSDALEMLMAVGNEPGYAPFYVTRSKLLDLKGEAGVEDDLNRALESEGSDWPVWRQMLLFQEGQGNWAEALRLSTEAMERFPGDFAVRITHARILVYSEMASEALEILRNINVLPSESARESHRLYEWSNVMIALTLLEAGNYDAAIEYLNAGLEWPEHLGQGRPYDPESRLLDFLLEYSYRQIGDRSRAMEATRRVAQYTARFADRNALENYLGYFLMSQNGETDGAEALLDKWQKQQGGLASRWVVAKVRGDDQTLRALRDEQPAFFDQIQFRLIERALRLPPSQ